MQPPPIEDLIATKSNGKDLDKATVDEVIHVYIDVFVNIEKMLQTDTEDFPSASLISIKQALNTILLKFEFFLGQPLDNKLLYDLKIVIPLLHLDIGAIISASKTLDTITPDQQVYLDASDQQVYRDATDMYTVALLKCRYQIVLINRQLKRV